MTAAKRETDNGSVRWRNLGPLPKLRESGRQLVKIDGRQIALFEAEGALFAINNHCPHEGYPLIEGELKAGCRLACHWHSWTFDLATGRAEVGRDPVRRYDVMERDGDIWIDLTEPSANERQAKAVADLQAAVDEYDYERMARSLARYRAAGGRVEQALTQVIATSPGRLEEGMTHALAAGADWLAAGRIVDPEAVPGGPAAHALVPALEFVAHLSHDMLHSLDKAIPDGRKAWNEAAFLQAIENQDEAEAIAHLRGGLDSGLKWADLEPVFARASLAHYLGFGHAPIYVQKAGELIDELGEGLLETLSCALVRYLTVANREDLIPEFRDLAPALSNWDGTGRCGLTAEQISGQSTRKLLQAVSQAGGDIDALYDALLGAAAVNLLRFDADWQDAVDVPVSKTVGWLHFTHAITFASAVRLLAGKYPELWPAGLLQTACFIGRNASYLTRSIEMERWQIDDPEEFLDRQLARFFNHDESAYIYFVHDLKLTMAVRAEIRAGCSDETARLLLAALNRYLSGHKRRKAPARSACQAQRLVEMEGM